VVTASLCGSAARSINSSSDKTCVGSLGTETFYPGHPSFRTFEDRFGHPQRVLSDSRFKVDSSSPSTGLIRRPPLGVAERSTTISSRTVTHDTAYGCQ
jgi:hypothetical protein